MKRVLALLIFILIIPNVKAQTVEVVDNTPAAMLGEGAIWHQKDNVLYWVDITGRQLYRYNPLTGKNRCFEMSSMIGTVVPAANTFMAVVALETGLYGISYEGESVLLSGFPENEAEGNRFNDGKCDPQGRLWVGTMNKQAAKEAGNLYCFDGSVWQNKQAKTTISNGMAWSLDGRTLYYIDTAEYTVFAYDFNNESGEIGNRRVAIQVPVEMGGPDGMTIDSDGMLWIAHWGGNAVIRWNPLNGEVLQKIDIPAPHVTSCAFGGDDLKTLYVTTAREGLTAAQLEEFPLSGRLFRIKLSVCGIPANNFLSFSE